MTNPAAAKDKIEGTACGLEFHLFERLEVIDDPQPRSAVFNMAADESLLLQVGDVPVLRIYRWLRPATSFGYFTSIEAVLRPEEERELVRRWTGGGIVKHGNDFTYSLLIPRREVVASGAPGGSYKLIHAALASALGAARVVSHGAVLFEDQDAVQSAPDLRCFEHPVAHDLISGGRKLAGAAQRRTRRGLLHQGSVQEIGHEAAPDWREQLARSLPEALCASPARRQFTPAEERTATTLAEEKYATQAWLCRS